MEPKFEIRYYTNQAMLAEFYRKVSLGPRPPVVIFGILIYVYCLVMLYLADALNPLPDSMILLPVLLVVVFFMPDWVTWINLRRIRKQNDGAIPVTVVTAGDTLEMHEGMVHYTIEYRKLQKVIRLKHSYALMIGKRNGLILDPACFTKGTFAEFKQFLREKRPDLNIPE